MHIYLPEELVQRIERSIDTYKDELPSLSPTKKRNKMEDIYFLCHYIIEKIAQKDENTGLSQAANVSSVKMKFYVNKYREILNFLIENYIVKATEPYSSGYYGAPPFTRAYRLYSRMDLSPVVKLELTNSYLVEKLKNKPKHHNLPQYLERYREEILRKVYLDTEEAEKYLLEEYRRGPYEIMDFYRLYLPVYKLKTGSLYFKQEKSGRIHHNFSNLSSKLRRFLKVSNENNNDWVEVDISSCTPFLFSTYLIKQGHNSIDALLFHEMTRSGDFYTQLLEHVCYAETIQEGHQSEELEEYLGSRNRKRLKEAILKFFNRKPENNRNYRKREEYHLYESIRDSFPNVFKQLEHLQIDTQIEGVKSGMYNLITPMESSVMVEYLIPQLLEKNLVGITRHDGVLCLSKDAEEIKKIIETGFKQQLGVSPTVKIK